MDKQTQMFLAIIVIALLAYYLYNKREHKGGGGGGGYCAPNSVAPTNPTLCYPRCTGGKTCKAYRTNCGAFLTNQCG